MKQFKIALLCAALPFVSANVNADVEGFKPAGLWKTTHYEVNVVNPKPVEIMVCVNKDGTWKSLDSTDGMGGSWTVKGHELLLSGNGTGSAGTGDVTVFSAYKILRGVWSSWQLDKPTTHTTYNSVWRFAGKTCPETTS